MSTENNLVINGYRHNGTDAGLHSDPEGYEDITGRLDHILFFLENELENKQRIINSQAAEITRLRESLHEKEQLAETIQQKLNETEERAESNRQLINKLLGDISHYQNDIEWYKRTYEKRSIWGVMKEKLAKANLPPEKPEQCH